MDSDNSSTDAVWFFAISNLFLSCVFFCFFDNLCLFCCCILFWMFEIVCQFWFRFYFVVAFYL
jgi:hypothetical protein